MLGHPRPHFSSSGWPLMGSLGLLGFVLFPRRNVYSWTEPFPMGFQGEPGCFGALCPHCLVTLTLQPSPAIRLCGNFPGALPQVCGSPVVPERLMAVTAANRMRRNVQRLRKPRNGQGAGRGYEFPCWVGIPREMASSKEVWDFLPLQSNLKVIRGWGGRPPGLS